MKVLALGDAVGPNAEVVTNEVGAKQSHAPFRFDLIPPGALFAVAEILAHGAEKYAAENWRGITDPQEHANHALTHYYSWLWGDDSEGTPLEHLARAFCRTAFALEMEVLRLRAGGPQRPKVAYLSADLTPGAHGDMLATIARTRAAQDAAQPNTMGPAVAVFEFDGEWVEPKTKARRRKLIEDMNKRANSKLSKMMADTIFPELKKKRPAKKVAAKKRVSRAAK